MDLLTGGLVLNLYTLFLALMLLFFQENDKSTKSNIAFVRLLGLLAILVGVSALGDIGGLCEGNGIYLKKLSSYIVFALDPFGFLFSLSYIDCYTVGADKKLRNLFIIPMRIYAYVNFLMVTISSLFGLKLFYYYDGLQYNRGPLYLTRASIHVVLCMIVLLYVVTFRKNIMKNYRLPIMLFPLIVALGGFLQMTFINMNIEYAATVFACLVLMIYVQKRDVNLDYLTGVVNRRGIDMALSKAIMDSGEKDFAAVMIDVDFFKSINDNFGHKTGDEVLESIAGVLTNSFDDGDVVGRFGGDEFCVITQVCDELELGRRIEKIREAISAIDWSKKKEMQLSVSTGAAVYDRNTGMQAKDFMESIDKRMYEEKMLHHLSDRRKA